MNCQECENLFDEMIDKRVEEAMRQRMELHLSRCGVCRGRLEHRKNSHTLMFRILNSANGRMHLPKDFADRLVAECRIQPKRSFFPSLPRWALIAAALAIIAGFVFAAAVVGGAGTGSERGTGTAETTETAGITETASPTKSDSVLPVIPEVSVVPAVPGVLGMGTQPSTNYQLQTNQGETTMITKKAATAALASAMAAAPLATARGDEYQYIVSGYPAANESRSLASTTTSLEARGYTQDASAGRSLYSTLYRAMIILFK